MAAIEWLCRAQDVTTDGGVCGRYSLQTGWSSSYPETTGYIIPTFLALADDLHDDRFVQRAARAVRFLLSVQLPNGAFPGGEIRENRVHPSVFNTAQILGGLTAWHRCAGDAESLRAAERAAEWLLSMQGADGAWRRHVYGGIATTYTAYASCWLAEFGEYRGIRAYQDAAGRHLDWVLGHQDSETGWFDLAGFTADDLAIELVESQLTVRGKQTDDSDRVFLHRGIAARQFQRTFVLAEGIEVLGADLKNGLLSIDLARPEPERVVKTVAIRNHE